MLLLDFINVGNGDSILIREEENGRRKFAMLVDCGHDNLLRDDHPAPLDPRSRRIYAGDFLKKQGIERLDLLLATHFHRDHIGGLGRVLEAAEADFGDSAGYGFLFEIGAIDAADLQDFLDRELPASWIFAKDSNRYYIYTEPTDVQLYRRGGEEAITDEDRETWSALSALGPIVREDTIQRNNLTPYSAR